MAEIILSDESINCYGSRVLTEGIDLKFFKKNPVMFWNHHRSDDWTGNTETLPIGRWERLRIDGKKLIGTPDIDPDDEFSSRVLSKVEKGYINAASIGIDIVEVSTDPKLMLKGQTRATITKSILIEVSLCDIPANPNAVSLKAEDDKGGLIGVMILSNGKPVENLDEILPLIELNKSENLNSMSKNTDTSNTEEKKVETKSNPVSAFFKSISNIFSSAETSGEVDEAKLKSEMETLNSKFESLKAENDSNLEKLTAAQNSLTEKETEITTLKSNLEKLTSEKEDLQTKLTDAETAKTDAETAQQAAEEKVTEKENEVKEKEDTIKKIVEDNGLTNEDTTQEAGSQSEDTETGEEPVTLSKEEKAFALMNEVYEEDDTQETENE